MFSGSIYIEGIELAHSWIFSQLLLLIDFYFGTTYCNPSQIVQRIVLTVDHQIKGSFMLQKIHEIVSIETD